MLDKLYEFFLVDHQSRQRTGLGLLLLGLLFAMVRRTFGGNVPETARELSVFITACALIRVIWYCTADRAKEVLKRAPRFRLSHSLAFAMVVLLALQRYIPFSRLEAQILNNTLRRIIDREQPESRKLDRIVKVLSNAADNRVRVSGQTMVPVLQAVDTAVENPIERPAALRAIEQAVRLKLANKVNRPAPKVIPQDLPRCEDTPRTEEWGQISIRDGVPKRILLGKGAFSDCLFVLDNQRLVLFSVFNSRLIYSGGPLSLENVYFADDEIQFPVQASALRTKNQLRLAQSLVRDEFTTFTAEE